MRLVIFSHPRFFSSASMDRFASMIAQGMRAKGHSVEVWTAQPFVYRLPAPQQLKKWLGYIDELVVFPFKVRRRLRHCEADTLFVFTDEALGPWVPLVSNRPHVIHNHGFFALRSARGEFPGNRIRWSGRLYQRYIWRGFSAGSNFISISPKCQEDLTRYIPHRLALSKVVYNGLNYPFRPMAAEEACGRLLDAGLKVPNEGFLLHVGGNQFYKNRAGVLRIYKAYAERLESPLPLWMIGEDPTKDLRSLAEELNAPAEVRFLSGLSDNVVHAAYALTKALIFPSIWEGFGWPIAEAMASGSLILTTGEEPMNFVGGDAAVYLERMPEGRPTETWARQSAEVLVNLLQKSEAEKATLRTKGLSLVQRFNTQAALDGYEAIYAELTAQ